MHGSAIWWCLGVLTLLVAFFMWNHRKPLITMEVVRLLAYKESFRAEQYGTDSRVPDFSKHFLIKGRVMWGTLHCENLVQADVEAIEVWVTGYRGRLSATFKSEALRYWIIGLESDTVDLISQTNQQDRWTLNFLHAAFHNAAGTMQRATG